VDYLFGQVSIDKAFVDWSGNCGNLSAAVGPFALHSGFIPPERIPHNGVVSVRIWQANIGKTLVVEVPIQNGEVQELGGFELDGVTFPAAEIKVDFVRPTGEDEALFPTGNLIDDLEVPGIGTLNATLISAGIPTVFIDAESVGYTGVELQEAINSDIEALSLFETIRACGALKMGLVSDIEQAKTRQHTPKVAFVSRAKPYQTSSGKQINSKEIDLNVRALSMGKLHHAMMGTAAVAIASAASVPGTLVNLAAGGVERQGITFGHPSGKLTVGAHVKNTDAGWQVEKVSMSRSARIIMEGFVRVPSDIVK
jgi:probable AcnD-accessory protein PrpF